MKYINILFSSAKHLFLKDNQLGIADENGEVWSYPIEDIDSVVLENNQMTLSASLLSFLMQNEVALFVCNDQHLPCGVAMPFNSYSRQLKNLQLQLNISQPLKKSLWQSIIKQKILNQSKTLQMIRKDSNILIDLSKKILSGDRKNVEAVAAKKYFELLFSKEFTRNKDNFINSCLNYAYSIVRGAIARTLVIYGFETSIGIHHCSQLNNFNLADDLIEVYRPIIDAFVFKSIDLSIDELNTKIKQQLLNILNIEVEIENKKQSISYSIFIFIESLKRSFNDNKILLKFPSIRNVKVHKSE